MGALKSYHKNSMIYMRYAYRALQYRNRHSRERVPFREKGLRKVLRFFSGRRSGIFNRHFHSAHDSRGVTDFHKLFGALKNSPSVVTPVCGFFRRRHGILFYGLRRIVSHRFAHFDCPQKKLLIDR